MHICVLGAGVIGISTAYYLERAGHRVTVIERNPQAGLETSYANGGQLSYSYVAPLAGPGVVPKIPPWLLRRDSPLRFYPRFDLDQWRWCLAFLAACNRPRAETTTVQLLRLAYYSRDRIHEIVRAHPDLGFDYRRNGKLVIFSDRESFEAARRNLDFQRAHGSEQEALGTSAVLDREPALRHAAARIVGGIHTATEDAGDCRDFCAGMESYLRSRGVDFMTGVRVTRMRRDLAAKARRIASVETTAGAVEADAYVMALGAANAWFAKTLGFHLPIYPLKGYSLTLDTKGFSGTPQISITDSKYKIVYALLGEELRVAGMADIAGYDTTPDPERVALLAAQARETFPDAADFDGDLRPWAGLRPATPRGTPVIGRSPYHNLYLNAGHGALGWTLACGCAKVVADLVDGYTPEIGLDGLTLERAGAG